MMRLFNFLNSIFAIQILLILVALILMDLVLDYFEFIPFIILVTQLAKEFIIPFKEFIIPFKEFIKPFKELLFSELIRHFKTNFIILVILEYVTQQ
jgi:hypothetical protein